MTVHDLYRVNLLPVLLALTAAAAGTTTAQGATVLDFNLGLPDGSTIPIHYGDHAAGTPHIGVTFSGGFTPWCTWAGGYGDLSNITYGCNSLGNPSSLQSYSIQFSADPGWFVMIQSFDLAGFGASRTITQILVGSQTYNNVSAPAGTHNTLTPNETGTSVQLVVQGPDFFNGGLDNLRFSERAVTATVPEPGTSVLAGLGVALAVLAYISSKRLR